MDSRLKQRLVGAAVLVALAVIFLPMLVQGPAPDSGVSDVPLSMPDAPRADYETRDLPLVSPGNTPDGGAVGMQSTPPAATSMAAPAPVTPPAASSTASAALASTPATSPANPPAAPAPNAPAPSAAPLPATTAAGDYAVSFGTYATTTAADAMIASLRASQLPGFREATMANGKPAWRVRIGPYATRADAEIARLRASHVRDEAGARVVTLDAPAAASSSTAPTTPAKPTPSTAAPSKPAAAPAAGATGFALQLAAFSKPEDAAALREKLRAAGFSAFTESVATDKGALTRVRVGPVITRAEADQLKAQVRAKVGLDGVVRPHP
jgi:cell division septation protein DedD